MVSSPLPQVAANAVDISGVSVCTAVPASADSRAGTIYDPVTLAAAAPTWFHPLHDGTFLMLNSRRWHDATTATDNPGAYTAYTEDTSPSWVVIGGPTGMRQFPPGATVSVPRNTSVTVATLTAAASRPPGFVYLLSAVTIGGSSQALLQHFHVALNGAVGIQAEEVLPTVTLAEDNIVVFDKGIQFCSPWIYLYGTDAEGNVYKMVKSWGRVGVNDTRRARAYSGIANNTLTWEYFTGTGYSQDAAEIAPLPLTTAGPMAFAEYRNTVFSTTVEEAGDARIGVVWSSSSGRAMTRVTEVSLGSVADDSYLGGGLQLQPQLGANPLAPAMTGANAGIVYVVSTKSTASGADSLLNTWAILPVRA